MKRALHLILLFGVLCTALSFGQYGYRFYSTRSRLLQELGAAATVTDLQGLVGDHGIFLVLRDGSWIAISYEDCHDGGPSVSVAADSGGGVLDSRTHFCGHFGFYTSFRQRFLKGKEPAEVAARFTPRQIAVYSRLFPGGPPSGPIMEREDVLSHNLYQVERTSDVKAAREALKAMGFSSTWSWWTPPPGSP